MENAETMYQILVYVSPKILHAPPFTKVPLSGKMPIFVHDWNKRHVTGFF